MNAPERVQKSIRVVLADDHDLVRSGVKALLQMVEGVAVIAEARDGQELLGLVETLQPDVILTDIEMPRMDGLTAISQIHTRFPAVAIIVLSMYDSLDFIRRAVANGASGYLLKSTGRLELEQALHNVISGRCYFDGHIAARLLEPAQRTVEDELTQRQIQILKLVALGRSSKEIGFELELSPKTVDVHKTRIMERLDLHDIANLTLYAARMGLVKV